MESDIRIKSALKVRIGEAKSLPSKSCRILPGCPNTYCVINLDKEVLFETEIVYGTPCPFFCEQFEFEIPRAFWTVGFFLVTTDTTFSITNRSTIGKVTFTKDQLCSVPNKDQWYGLKSVKCDSEAQGKANIAMCITTEGDSVLLHVRLKECANLYMNDLQKVQPYAVLEIVGPNNSIRTKVQETKTLRRPTSMQWKNQTYEFKLNEMLKRCQDDLSNLSLRVDFYHHNGVFREGTFLGEVLANLANVSDTWSDRWYFLCPKMSDIVLQPNHDLGSLRLRIEYKEDHILPNTHYQPLLQLLLNSLDKPQEIETSVIVLISTLFNEQLINIAQSLVRIFLHLNRVEELLLCLTDLDMSKTSNPNTLFRANSLATKGVDELMKMIGRPYLRGVLKPTLDKIHKENLPCEIDPARLRSNDTLDCNLNNLTQSIDGVYSAIVNSGGNCPYTLSSLFSNLQKQAVNRFPDVEEIQYTAVSGFVFLRLFAPAILNPKLFQLQYRRPNRETSRTLTLVSKVIQSLGNLDTHQAILRQGKEKYMEAISQRVLDMKHVNGVKRFLEDVCVTERKTDESCTNCAKEGTLVEYRVTGITGREYSKRKKLYRLSETGLTALRHNNGTYMIRKADIRCVSRVDEDAFGVPHIFQIIHNKGTLYLRANNSVDHYDWIVSISRLCRDNQCTADRYHTGAILHNKWTCCSSKIPTHEDGCKESGGPDSQVPDIDIYRELQRLYQIMKDGLSKLEGHCTLLSGQIASGAGGENQSKQLESLTSLISVVRDLSSTHQHYLKNDNMGLSPGSRHIPLGPVPVG